MPPNPNIYVAQALKALAPNNIYTAQDGGGAPVPPMPSMPQAPPAPQVPMPEGIPAPLKELGYTGQKMLGQANRTLNGVLQGGNPVVEAVSGVQSAMQNIPLPVELISQFRRAIRNTRFPFAEMGQSMQGIPGLPQLPTMPPIPSSEPGTPTSELAAGDFDNPMEIPIF